MDKLTQLATTLIQGMAQAIGWRVGQSMPTYAAVAIVILSILTLWHG
jgi:hypothetical protein